jgi:hypothetical protein
MWERREHQRRLGQRRVFRGHERDGSTRQFELFATLRVGSGEGEAESWMLGDERTQLASGVA